MKASDSLIVPGDLIEIHSLWDDSSRFELVLFVDRVSGVLILHLLDELMNYHKIVLYDLSIVDVVYRFYDCL